MRQPIRYYITKSGEEPTVRSVRIALGAGEGADCARDDSMATDDPPTQSRESRNRRHGAKVGRLMKQAVRKRSSKP